MSPRYSTGLWIWWGGQCRRYTSDRRNRDPPSPTHVSRAAAHCSSVNFLDLPLRSAASLGYRVAAILYRSVDLVGGGSAAATPQTRGTETPPNPTHSRLRQAAQHRSCPSPITPSSLASQLPIPAQHRFKSTATQIKCLSSPSRLHHGRPVSASLHLIQVPCSHPSEHSFCVSSNAKPPLSL